MFSKFGEFFYCRQYQTEFLNDYFSVRDHSGSVKLEMHLAWRVSEMVTLEIEFLFQNMPNIFFKSNPVIEIFSQF